MQPFARCSRQDALCSRPASAVSWTRRIQRVTDRQQGVSPSSQRRPLALAAASTSATASGDAAAPEQDGPETAARYMLSNGLMDYYEVLQVDDDASVAELKKAYRSLAKVCHPDYLGERGHDLCIVINEAYAVLSDPEARARYNARLEQALRDDSDSYTGKSLSKWMPTVRPAMAKNEDPAERRAVFVDEFSCIGCKQCVWCASATFRMEEEHGRSRVFAQWLDPEDKIQASIDSCPVSCIHWVDRDDLAPLEYVTQVKVTQRANIANMMAGMGGNVDAFSATVVFLKERKRRAEAQAAAAKNRAYSPAQEAARRSATDQLRQQQMGWFSQFGDFFAAASEHLNSAVRDDPDLQQVGRRKRVVKWDTMARPAPPGYSVPPEFAMVRVSVDDTGAKWPQESRTLRQRKSRQ